MTWEFGVNDAATVNKWSEAVIRDAEKQLFFAPFMTSMTEGAMRSPDIAKGSGIIRVHSEFAGMDKKGRTLTLHNVADIDAAEQGIQGDALLRDTGADLDVYTMTLRYDAIAQQVRSSGEMSEKSTVLDFRTQARAKLGRWARFKTEGGIWLALNGLTSWNNTTKLKHWPQNGAIASVYGNTIQAFDSDHIAYAGAATSNATVTSGDVMTAQFLTKLETKSFEDLDIPLEGMDVDGQPELILFLSRRGCEQLLYDEDWINANRAGVQSSDNPIVKRSIGKFGMIRVVPYDFCLNPAANVSQAILCGRDALQMAKVDDFSWFEDFEDTRKRRKVISIGGMFGVAATYLNSTRRNAIAVRHYVRS